MSFAALRAANRTRQREWDKEDGIDLAYRGNELAGEAGEACNVIKKIVRERLGIRGSRAGIGDLADELADVVICADLIAMQEDIDLEAAVRCKFNATSKKYGLATQLGTSRLGPDNPTVTESAVIAACDVAGDTADSLDRLRHVIALALDIVPESAVTLDAHDVLTLRQRLSTARLLAEGAFSKGPAHG